MNDEKEKLLGLAFLGSEKVFQFLIDPAAGQKVQHVPLHFHYICYGQSKRVIVCARNVL